MSRRWTPCTVVIVLLLLLPLYGTRVPARLIKGNVCYFNDGIHINIVHCYYCYCYYCYCISAFYLTCYYYSDAAESRHARVLPSYLHIPRRPEFRSTDLSLPLDDVRLTHPPEQTAGTSTFGINFLPSLRALHETLWRSCIFFWARVGVVIDRAVCTPSRPARIQIHEKKKVAIPTCCFPRAALCASVPASFAINNRDAADFPTGAGNCCWQHCDSAPESKVRSDSGSPLWPVDTF